MKNLHILLSSKTQPKLTDLDCPFWLAPMPLYVSQLRARLNSGSASIRLHLHGLGSFLMCSVITPVLPAHPLLPLPNRYGLRERTIGVMVNFTRVASPDERIRLTLGMQRWPRTEILGRTVNQDLQGIQEWVC
jgi:hypothetical protein